MRQDRFKCELMVDEHEPNVIIIKPLNLKDFQNDSIYEFKLPTIHSTDGQIIKPQKLKYITAPSIAYASIDDIKAKLGDVEISDEKILYHIREASRMAEVLITKSYEKQNINFTQKDLIEFRGQIEDMRNEHWWIWHFVVLQASYDTLTNLYILMATRPEKVKEMLSDLTKEVSYDLQWIKDLLDKLKKELDEALNYIYTTADPVFALRGKTAIPIYPNIHAPYHGLNGMGGYGRSYNTTSYGGGYYGNRGGRF